MTPWAALGEAISGATGQPLHVKAAVSVPGGCINRSIRLDCGSVQYFVKYNAPEHLRMFQAEMAGLLELRRATTALRAPEPVCAGSLPNLSFLVLEYVALESPGVLTLGRLGHGLAELHNVIGPGYGWRIDNTIGSTPQPNGYRADWATFWRQQRLGFQLQLAHENGYHELTGKGEKLLDRLPDIFRTHSCKPSLLHGDLWSGNVAATGRGEPVLFDPAVYYGDRETDIAMTKLFGGFGKAFYDAYEEAWPLAEGHEQRGMLYQLYHLLNHLNLFGSSYLARCDETIMRLLAETGSG